MEDKSLIISKINISKRIFSVRGVQVMLDSNLADLYEVSVKVLNQVVKRNIERFPYDFMFQLNKIEFDFLRSQFVTSSIFSISVN